MAEAFGIVAGVIGLLPICANGCFFIESICKAHGGVEEHMVRVQLQRRVLKAWGHVWEVPLEVPKQRTNTKLQRWIDQNQPLANDVLDTLSDISNLFADVTNLEARYGIVLKQRHPQLKEISVKAVLSDRKNVGVIQKDLERRRQHMSIIDRCHFQLRGTDKFDKLVLRLREFIDGLRAMCQEVQASVRCFAPSACLTSKNGCSKLTG